MFAIDKKILKCSSYSYNNFSNLDCNNNRLKRLISESSLVSQNKLNLKKQAKSTSLILFSLFPSQPSFTLPLMLVLFILNMTITIRTCFYVMIKVCKYHFSSISCHSLKVTTNLIMSQKNVFLNLCKD